MWDLETPWQDKQNQSIHFTCPFVELGRFTGAIIDIQHDDFCTEQMVKEIVSSAVTDRLKAGTLWKRALELDLVQSLPVEHQSHERSEL